MKFLLPLLWIPLFGFMTMRMFTGSSPEAQLKWFFLMFWITGAVVFVWNAKRLKTVSVDDKFLYASNYRKEIAIPLSDIYDVTENIWINARPVTIHLKSPTEFGDKIVFMPKSRAWMFCSHPVVAELKQLAKPTVARR